MKLAGWRNRGPQLAPLLCEVGWLSPRVKWEIRRAAERRHRSRHSLFARAEGPAVPLTRARVPTRYDIRIGEDAMATTTRPQITVDEYLHSSESPDRDYVDGGCGSETWAN